MEGHGDVDRFEEQIERMRSQLATIEEHGAQREAGEQTGVTEDLRVAIEELYVAEEELRLEHEELLGARSVIEEHQRRYEELFQLAPDAYFVTDPRGMVREANRSAAELLGIEPRYLVGKPLATFVDLGDRADLRGLINSFDGTTRVDDWCLRLSPRQGKPIPASITATAARDVRNALIGIRWLVRDVTVRERNERELLALADRRRAILDSAPEGICRLDADGSVVYANPAVERMLGRSETDLRISPLIDVLVDGQARTELEGDSRVRLERAFAGLRPGTGQWDYATPGSDRTITLSYNLAAVASRGQVEGAVVTLSDVTERRQLERDLRRRADHDALTGLLNRSAFERELERELALGSRYRTTCAVLLLDVDSLKGTNDAHGHLAGDAVLRTVANTLRSRLRQTDIAGRLGGDEFGVVLPRADESAARTVAEEILAAARGHAVAPGGLGASLSLGVALVKIPGLRATDVFRCADRAMYEGKHAGGDRIVVMDATLP